MKIKGLACAGDNCIDYYDETGEAYFGGNPVNVAVNASKAGYQTTYIGAVGDDEYGEGFKRILGSKKVDLSHMYTLPGSTAMTHVTRVNGERVFGDYDEGVTAHFTLSEADKEFMASYEIIVSGIWGRMEKDIVSLKDTGSLIAFDFADKLDDPMVKTVSRSLTYAFFSYKEDDEYIRDYLKEIVSQGCCTAVVTLGDKGSLAFNGERFIRFGIVPCKEPVKDTLGAGDSYIAGFLCASLEGATIAECMENGALWAARTLALGKAW
ncbi:MAG: fructoselysine 6-kinase [Eubacteriales bacterium]|nr:fructoselysine 6-kinase [Eubacteriales bacterium]